MHAETFHCTTNGSRVHGGEHMSGKPYVLIVDDDPDTCELFHLVLAQEGFRTRIAHSIEQALAAIDVEAPHVILLDYHLNGSGACTGLLEQVRQRDLQSEVVLVTGHANWAEKAELLNLEHVLQKPADPSKLVTLCKMLTARES